MESTITPIGKGEVLLHVGLHKTGTTALQVALADARDDTWRHLLDRRRDVGSGPVGESHVSHRFCNSLGTGSHSNRLCRTRR